MKNYRKSRFKTFCALAALACNQPSVWSCAVLSTDTGETRIDEESAVIIWDEKHKTQHFIRQATFDTQAKNIGFLVPTPNIPKLSKVEDYIFYRLEENLRPRTVHQRVEQGYRLGTILEYLFARRVQTVFNTASSALNTSTDEVDVISEQEVAGFDTAILRANDVSALQKWLKKNGYVSGPTFDEWLRPYVQKGWFITAFKYAKTASTQYISSDAVRMSFKTDKPFFPYREPQGQGSAKQSEYSNPRLLRVFMIAAGRMDGKLENGKTQTTWSSQVPYAQPFLMDDVTGFQETPQISALMKPGNVLTVFEDRAAVRSNAGDLFWEFSKQQTPIEPPPIIKKNYVPTPIPVEPFLLLLAGGYFLWRKRSQNEI